MEIWSLEYCLTTGVIELKWGIRGESVDLGNRKVSIDIADFVALGGYFTFSEAVA